MRFLHPRHLSWVLICGFILGGSFANSAPSTENPKKQEENGLNKEDFNVDSNYEKPVNKPSGVSDEEKENLNLNSKPGSPIRKHAYHKKGSENRKIISRGGEKTPDQVEGSHGENGSASSTVQYSSSTDKPSTEESSAELKSEKDKEPSDKDSGETDENGLKNSTKEITESPDVRNSTTNISQGSIEHLPKKNDSKKAKQLDLPGTEDRSGEAKFGSPERGREQDYRRDNLDVSKNAVADWDTATDPSAKPDVTEGAARESSGKDLKRSQSSTTPRIVRPNLSLKKKITASTVSRTRTADLMAPIAYAAIEGSTEKASRQGWEPMSIPPTATAWSLASLKAPSNSSHILVPSSSTAGPVKTFKPWSKILTSSTTAETVNPTPEGTKDPTVTQNSTSSDNVEETSESNNITSWDSSNSPSQVGNSDGKKITTIKETDLGYPKQKSNTERLIENKDLNVIVTSTTEGSSSSNVTNQSVTSIDSVTSVTPKLSTSKDSSTEKHELSFPGLKIDDSLTDPDVTVTRFDSTQNFNNSSIRVGLEKPDQNIILDKYQEGKSVGLDLLPENKFLSSSEDPTVLSSMLNISTSEVDSKTEKLLSITTPIIELENTINNSEILKSNTSDIRDKTENTVEIIPSTSIKATDSSKIGTQTNLNKYKIKSELISTTEESSTTTEKIALSSDYISSSDIRNNTVEENSTVKISIKNSTVEENNYEWSPSYSSSTESSNKLPFNIYEMNQTTNDIKSTDSKQNFESTLNTENYSTQKDFQSTVSSTSTPYTMGSSVENNFKNMSQATELNFNTTLVNGEIRSSPEPGNYTEGNISSFNHDNETTPEMADFFNITHIHDQTKFTYSSPQYENKTSSEEEASTELFSYDYGSSPSTHIMGNISKPGDYESEMSEPTVSDSYGILSSEGENITSHITSTANISSRPSASTDYTHFSNSYKSHSSDDLYNVSESNFTGNLTSVSESPLTPDHLNLTTASTDSSIGTETSDEPSKSSPLFNFSTTEQAIINSTSDDIFDYTTVQTDITNSSQTLMKTSIESKHETVGEHSTSQTPQIYEELKSSTSSTSHIEQVNYTGASDGTSLPGETISQVTNLTNYPFELENQSGSTPLINLGDDEMESLKENLQNNTDSVINDLDLDSNEADENIEETISTEKNFDEAHISSPSYPQFSNTSDRPKGNIIPTSQTVKPISEAAPTDQEDDTRTSLEEDHTSTDLDNRMLDPTSNPSQINLFVQATYKEVCSALDELKDSIIRLFKAKDIRNINRKQIIIINTGNSDCSSQSLPDSSQVAVHLMLTDIHGQYDDSLTDTFIKLCQQKSLDFRYPVDHVEKVMASRPDLEAGSQGSGTMIAAIVISSIAGICLLFLTALLVIMRKRQKGFSYGQRCTPVSLEDYSLDNISVYNSVRRKALRASKRSYGNPAFDDPNAVTHVLNFASLVNFSSDRARMDEEFSQIPLVVVKPDELPPGAEPKNRYANVIPLPETRVHLRQKQGTESLDQYINANYVKGAKAAEKFYIACQAPLQETVNDFWLMIWEQQSRMIIMLTDLYENGVEKCADYLPPSEVLDCHRVFGDLQVTLKKREVREKYIISSLQLKNLESNLWREVTHIWYVSWPHQGVPTEPSAIIALLIEARSFIKSKELDSPIVVHCSPGTGRTGSVIAIDICIREFETNRTVDIPRTVYNVRRDRAGSVQTKDQYAYIYQVLHLYATKLTGGGLDSI